MYVPFAILDTNDTLIFQNEGETGYQEMRKEALDL